MSKNSISLLLALALLVADPASIYAQAEKSPIESIEAEQSSSALRKESAELSAPAKSTATEAAAAPGKSTMLFGRIEEIAGSQGAQFPVLKAQKPKLDTRGTTPTTLRAQAQESRLSGTVVRNFPQDFNGTWGGTLAVWRFEQDPVAYQIDPEEAKWTAQAIKQGAVGQVNFNFSQAGGGKIILEPAQICFMVPMKDTYASQQVNQMLGGMGGGMSQDQGGAMMKQMMGSLADSMKVPLIMQLGNFETSGMVTGISGNQLRSTLLKNELRELSPTVLEQQLVTSQVETNAKTGKVTNGYGETVLRFTRQTADQFYVQAVVVAFTANRHFEEKTVLYGTVRKGQVVQNNPDPMSGLGDLSRMMGGQGGGRMPQLPSGQNPFQNLFPQ
jgi:hypothetical protein